MCLLKIRKLKLIPAKYNESITTCIRLEFSSKFYEQEKLWPLEKKPSWHMTFIQHRINNITSWRCIDVDATLSQRCLLTWKLLTCVLYLCTLWMKFIITIPTGHFIAILFGVENQAPSTSTRTVTLARFCTRRVLTSCRYVCILNCYFSCNHK